jgi:hypothetical protein
MNNYVSVLLGENEVLGLTNLALGKMANIAIAAFDM